jgi:hypothetical protein
VSTNVTITLQRLISNGTKDGASESPYVWPALLWVDDTTLATPDLVAAAPPALYQSREIVQGGMRAGDSADIPFPLGSLGVSFEDNLSTRMTLVGALVWSAHDTPENVAFAGLQAFVSELRAGLADNLVTLAGADAEERKAIIDAIKTRVRSKIKSAISNALSGWQKVDILLGTLTLDDAIDGDFIFFQAPSASEFVMNFDDTQGNSYSIEGSADVRTPVIDLCQAQVDQVAAAKGVVDGIQSRIMALQAELQHATPQEKSGIVHEINDLSAQLPAALAALDDARKALQSCRNRWGIGDSGVTGVVNATG